MLTCCAFLRQSIEVSGPREFPVLPSPGIQRVFVYAMIMASRAMYLQVGWMLDQNIKCSIEAAAAKCFASDAAMKVTTDAVQILAGAGYMKGAVVEKLMRDAKLTQIFEAPTRSTASSAAAES